MLVGMRVSVSGAVLFSTMLFSPVTVTASFPVLSLAIIVLPVTVLLFPVSSTAGAVDLVEVIVMLLFFIWVLFVGVLIA